MLKNLFDELALSTISYNVFNELLQNGPSSARQLSERLSIPRPSVYDQVKLLSSKGLVGEQNKDNKKVFYAEDPKNLPVLVEQKIKRLIEQQELLKKILPLLTKQSEFLEPKVKFYSGTEGVKQVLNNMLWYKDIETISMWPINEMIKILGENYFIDLNKRRIRQNISVRAIWPQTEKVNLKLHPFLGVGSGHLRQLRLSPKGIDWNMGYWLYQDKVSFIYSRKEVFGFTVQSKDFVDLLKTQFEVIWKISKPVKPQPKYTNSFLKMV